MRQYTNKRKPIPPKSGIGLRAEHYNDVLNDLPTVGWFEIHSENYFGEGGRPLYYLEKIAEHYPLSFHGVGLSLGSTDPLSSIHLGKLNNLIRRFEPDLVSEHLSWGSVNGHHLNELLPMPYTPEALAHMVQRVIQVQDILGRQILIENVSSYLEYKSSIIPEWEFISELSRQSGCGVLLDVNNIYVNSKNHGYQPRQFIYSIPINAVKEIHMAGHTVKQLGDVEILIDTHNKRITNDVWSLYETAVERFGQIPTLVEWDTDLPALSVLLDEANKANNILLSEIGSKQHEHIA